MTDIRKELIEVIGQVKHEVFWSRLHPVDIAKLADAILKRFHVEPLSKEYIEVRELIRKSEGEGE